MRGYVAQVKDDSSEQLTSEKVLAYISTMAMKHNPEKDGGDRKGRKMWCLADKRSIRVEYINMLKELRKNAREVLALWILGDRTAEYPPGLYPPSFPKLANVIGC